MQDLFDVYITKYALTTGAFMAKATACAVGTDMISVALPAGRGKMYYHRGEWHTSSSEARAKIEKMRAAKLKSLRKQMTALAALDVDYVAFPMKDGTP